jgi:hypothetical protein
MLPKGACEGEGIEFRMEDILSRVIRLPRVIRCFRWIPAKRHSDCSSSVPAYRQNQVTSSKHRSGLRVREITPADFDRVAELLGKSMGYSNQYFLNLLQRIMEHRTPAGFPKYGQLLESDGSTVGAIILIFSTIWYDGIPSIRCHVTGWSVEPPYRCYAALFFAKDLKRNNVTYINISAKSDTLPIIETQGFIRYSSGQFRFVPAIQFASRGSRAKVRRIGDVPNARFEPFEQELLLTHAKNGCICLWCVTAERAYPFAFRPRIFRRFIPGVQLVYCRDIENFVRFAGPIGRFLALRGRFVVRVDSNGPIRGLVGTFLKGVDCRYYKGPNPPRLGDLAYTHLAMCTYVPWKKKPQTSSSAGK